MISNMATEIEIFMRKVPVIEKRQLLQYKADIDERVTTWAVAERTLHALCIRRKLYCTSDERYISTFSFEEDRVTEEDLRFIKMFWTVLEVMPNSTQFDYNSKNALPLFFIDTSKMTTNKVCYVPKNAEVATCRRIKENTDLKWDKEDIRFAIVEDMESAEKLMKVGFRYIIAINEEAEEQEDRIEILKEYEEEEAWEDI